MAPNARGSHANEKPDLAASYHKMKTPGGSPPPGAGCRDIMKTEAPACLGTLIVNLWPRRCPLPVRVSIRFRPCAQPCPSRSLGTFTPAFLSYRAEKILPRRRPLNNAILMFSSSTWE